MKEQHRAGLRGAQTPFLEPKPHTPSAALANITRAALLPLLMLSLTACDLFGGPNPPPPPSDRPSVTAVSPADGTQDVALGTAVVATLSLPNDSAIDESTVGNSTVSLTQAGEAVAVSATPAVSGSTITLTPDEPLEPETTYTFSIDASVADESGETLAEAFSSSFTTGDGETDTGEPTLPEANLTSAEQLIFETQNTQTSEAQTLTISNTGDAAFTLSSLEPTDSQFVLTDTPTLPATISPGQSVDVEVAFKPTSLGPQEATLTVNGDSSLGTDLRGLSVKGDDGDNEPSLQWIFETFGLDISTGDPDPSTTSIVSFDDFDENEEARRAELNGTLSENERIIQRFQKAGSGDVTVEVLAAYGLDSDPVTEFGWYPVGDTASREEVFRIETGTGNAQTLNPEAVGPLSFDPGDSSFGFYSIWPGFNDREIYTQDSLNTFGGAIPHHVRIYPLPGESNAYILATEEFTQGFDYNDVVVVVRNVRPAGPEGLSCNQSAPIISDRVLSKSYDNFELQNLSGAPFADRLVFSRIGNISGNFNDRTEPFTDLKCHDLNVLRLVNESASALDISNVRITGSSSGAFILPGGGAEL